VKVQWQVNAGVADPVLAAQIRNRNTGLVLLQYAYDLFFGKSVAFHLWSFSSGQSLLQTGLTQWGNVSRSNMFRDLSF
jgi:hypothetical protein